MEVAATIQFTSTNSVVISLTNHFTLIVIQMTQYFDDGELIVSTEPYIDVLINERHFVVAQEVVPKRMLYALVDVYLNHYDEPSHIVANSENQPRALYSKSTVQGVLDFMNNVGRLVMELETQDANGVDNDNPLIQQLSNVDHECFGIRRAMPVMNRFIYRPSQQSHHDLIPPDSFGYPYPHVFRVAFDTREREALEHMLTQEDLFISDSLVEYRPSASVSVTMP